MAGLPLYHVTPRRPLRSRAAAAAEAEGGAAEAPRAEPAPRRGRREVRFAEPPPLRDGGSFGPARRGAQAAAAGGRGRGRRRRGRGAAAGGMMVGGSEGQAPLDATELRRRRKSPRLSAARAEEAEVEAAAEPEPGAEGLLEGERRGRARRAPRGGSRG